MYIHMQVYYRYNLVQQMKTLHLSVVCPELVLESEQSHEPATKSGKKGDEKSAGKAKDKEKSSKDKEKKLVAQKTKEEQPEVKQQGKPTALSYVDPLLVCIDNNYVIWYCIIFIAGDETQLPVKPPEWDLSIASLQEVQLHLIQ